MTGKAPPFVIHMQELAWHDSLENPETLTHAALEAAMMVLESPTPGEVTIVFTNDAFQISLNQRWRGRESSTNVLAFPAQPFTEESLMRQKIDAPVLGDIILAYETIIKEAIGQTVTPEVHTAHLLIHGFLHLQGYDHQNQEEAQGMMNLEIKAMTRLGFNNPYTELV